MQYLSMVVWIIQAVIRISWGSILLSISLYSGNILQSISLTGQVVGAL